MDLNKGDVVVLVSQPGKRLTVEDFTSDGDSAVCIWFAEPKETYKDEHGKACEAPAEPEKGSAFTNLLLRKTFRIADLRKP